MRTSFNCYLNEKNLFREDKSAIVRIQNRIDCIFSINRNFAIHSSLIFQQNEAQDVTFPWKDQIKRENKYAWFNIDTISWLAI